MIKRQFLLSVLFFFTVSLYSQSVILTPLKEMKDAVLPGQHLTLSYRITNQSNEKITTNCQLELPEKWICICQDSILTLDGNNSDLRLMTVLLPAKTAPGDYEVRYKLFTIDGQLISNTNQKIRVESVINLNVELLYTPAYVVAGAEGLATFLVSNKGNSNQEVTLLPLNCLLDSKTNVSIAADSSIHVQVKIPTDPFTAFHDLISYTLKVVSSNNTVENQTLAFKTAQFQVVPSFERENDAYFRFPLNFEISYLGIQRGTDNIIYAPQYDINGIGALDPANKNKVEFRFRGPDRFYLSSIGMYEEYYVKYSNKNFNTIAGDYSFQLSPLTEMMRYGRGIQSVLKTSRFDYGAFYSRPRFTPDLKEESAAFVQYHPSDKTAVKVGVLTKTFGNELKPATVFSLEANSELSKDWMLNAEISSGKQDGKTGNAAMLGIAGAWKKFRFNTNGIYSDKYFAGFYKNTRFYNATLNYALSRKIGFHLTYNHDDRNPERDTLYGMSPTNDFLLGGFTINYSGRNYLTFLAGYNERSDRMELNTFHYIDQTNRISFNHFIKENSIYAEVEIANTKNLITQTQGNSWSANSGINLFIVKNLFIEAFTGYYNTFRYSANRSSSWLYGGGLRWNYNQKIHLDCRVQNNYSPEDYYQDRNLLNLNLSYRPSKKHEFSLMGRKTLLRKQLSQEDMAFSVSYILHLGVPLKKIKQTGSVSGRIINMGVDKVSGIVVKLDGHTTITDVNGNFRFSNVRPDTYFLIIDPATTQVNYIPDRKTPIVVIVEPDKEIRVEFGLLKGASISGKVIFKKDNNGGNSIHEQNDKRPDEILIEITNGEETYRKLMDKEGKYSFINIRPGKWKVKSFCSDDCGGYTFEKSEYTLEVRSDQKSELNIPMVKKQKRIIFQDEPVKVQYR